MQDKKQNSSSSKGEIPEEIPTTEEIPAVTDIPKDIPIEQEIDKLKNLVSLIEDDKVRLDQSFAAFEEASALVKKLKTRLEVYREKARVIVELEKENLK